ncbi:hypothetical protein Goklo_024650, partial [Gossypium klotzschianum]|nr:hypothetical protein [Gossypium klotzschianum]
MEIEFLDKLENNAVVRIWLEKTRLEKGDSLSKGYRSELWDFTYISNFAYSCFTFGEVDLVPTIEEYMALLCCPRIQADKSLRNLILVHADTKKKVDVFALSIYGLMIFPRALEYVDEAVTDLFNRLDKRVTPVPTIFTETFRSLSECRNTGEGRFIGCAH